MCVSGGAQLDPFFSKLDHNCSEFKSFECLFSGVSSFEMCILHKFYLHRKENNWSGVVTFHGYTPPTLETNWHL